MSALETYATLAETSLRGEAPTAAQSLWILDSPEADLPGLLQAAFAPRKAHFGRKVMVHVLNNVQNGLCPEDCGYCSQNKDSKSAIRKYAMKSDDEILKEANEQVGSELAPEEYLGSRRLNLIRVRLGLHALRTDIRLTRACRGHSKDMVELEFFAHSSPVPGKETPWRRAALEGGQAGAENIAAGQGTGHGAISAWWYSPGHHRNMLGNHSSQGLGRHHDHWTQLFGG